MVCLTKTISTITVVLALAGSGGSDQAKSSAKPHVDFVDHPLDLPFLNGYKVKDCEMKWLMGANRWYIVLQKRGKYLAEARNAKKVLPKGLWYGRPGLERYSCRINGKSISISFVNGRSEADTAESVKTIYPYTGYVMCLIDVEG